MYRTGDLGRWLTDGNIEFLGRNDSQVKIRGFASSWVRSKRRLMEHAGVSEAVVIAREDALGDKRLVAYYTSYEEQDLARSSCVLTCQCACRSTWFRRLISVWSLCR